MKLTTTRRPAALARPASISGAWRWPATRHVRGTNLCLIGLSSDRVENRAILISAIDNLVKGASGQAIQNMNVMLGLPETTALDHPALFP